jgi:hypothetical protein
VTSEVASLRRRVRRLESEAEIARRLAHLEGSGSAADPDLALHRTRVRALRDHRFVRGLRRVTLGLLRVAQEG